MPLSPYTAYADLKPPSSPSPTPSGTKEESSGSFKMSDNAIQITEGINQANTGTSLVENDPPSSVSSNSPYQVYDDLKPPSSPTPNAPVISKYGAVESRQNPSVTQHESVSKQYTLSPFTMYEDLKPPSSPSPSWKEL
ncbi:hypothetical protein LIER_43749 [Lithospermum erythrorhizon]|uniref:Uncharacterized protein n=1 Tax=Lithospermum erythrorhizon TaxID=34254 RepID=A0AAV3QT59_LITER